MVSAKGKEKVTDVGGKGKRKRSSGGGGLDDDKTGRKRKDRGVLKFFEDAAYQVDEEEDSSECSSLEEENYDDLIADFKESNEHGKTSPLPHVKEEEMSEDEFDRMLEARYKPGASFVTYAEDGHDRKNSLDRDMYMPSAKDPTIWKVKCMVGRERYSALCLMQKFADLAFLGNKLQIISACALDHVKGFIIIEAEKQNDIYEACKGLSTIYSSKVTAVPSNEISRLLSVRSKSSAISEGMWARVKNGRYKGDLAQVVAVNNERKKVTVKLIPRIDLTSVAEKFGGGVPAKRNAIPAQRLITSSELEEFRPLIHLRRDRDTNLMCEVLDGMMLKDGYLYKKISMNSLSFWGVMPSEDELLNAVGSYPVINAVAHDDNGMFSVGQSLRIRVGRLKGYICRVLVVRRSKHKIITVKSEHLSEVRGRNPAIAQGEDSRSAKPFDFLGEQDGSRDWMGRAALSTEDNKWNAGGSTERVSNKVEARHFNRTRNMKCFEWLFVCSLVTLLSPFFCHGNVINEKVLHVGEELFKESLPLQNGARLYHLQGLKPQMWYEVKISYPASIPASFSLQLERGTPDVGLNRGRKLLNTEKIIFKADGITSLTEQGEMSVLVNLEPEGVVAILGKQEREYAVFNIVCDELLLGIPHEAWYVVVLVLLCLVLAFMVPSFLPAFLLPKNGKQPLFDHTLTKAS